MKALDRLLQKYRILKAARYITRGMSVLDIGCDDGTLFQALEDRISRGVGVDPLDHPWRIGDRFQRITGSFPEDVPHLGEFDAITMLAVLEHFPADKLQTMPGSCAKYLKSGGLLIITMPSPIVDYILLVLQWIRLIDGMSLEEHHGLPAKVIPTIFCHKYFTLKVKKSFQFGLNNLFVFQKK